MKNTETPQLKSVTYIHSKAGYCHHAVTLRQHCCCIKLHFFDKLHLQCSDIILGIMHDWYFLNKYLKKTSPVVLQSTPRVCKPHLRNTALFEWHMWINPQLEIVTDKLTIACCLWSQRYRHFVGLFKGFVAGAQCYLFKYHSTPMTRVHMQNKVVARFEGYVTCSCSGKFIDISHL